MSSGREGGSPDGSRIEHALAFAFLWRGIPVLYSGTEQGFTGDHENDRDALWRTGYPTATRLYRFVAQLNAIRSEHGIALAP